MNQPEKNTAKDIQQEKTGIEEEAAQQREMQPEGEAAGGIIKQEAEGGKREKRKKRGEEKDTVREIASWVFTICMAVIAALLIRSFIFIIVQVDGSSMMNTLHNENRLFVWRAGYTFGGQPQRGDIVICNYPKTKDGGYLDQKNTCYVKRVIGLPGDTVSIRQGTVYINGEALKESYLETERIDSQSMEAVVLEEGEYFLMGDNRSDSTDSRRMGAVERGKILGKAVGVVYPFTEFGSPYANTAG